MSDLTTQPLAYNDPAHISNSKIVHSTRYRTKAVRTDNLNKKLLTTAFSDLAKPNLTKGIQVKEQSLLAGSFYLTANMILDQSQSELEFRSGSIRSEKKSRQFGTWILLKFASGQKDSDVYLQV